MRRVGLILGLYVICHGVCTPAGLESWGRSDVQIEALSETVYVNGLPLRIQRAVGSGVVSLVEALRRQWTQETGVDGLQTDTRDDWTILSRLLDGHVQSLQWRGSGPEAELIWSSNDLRARNPNIPRIDLGLPPGCIVSRTIHGNTDAGRYVQQTARCALSPGATVASLTSNAHRQGFATSSSNGMLVAKRKGIEIVIVASKADASMTPAVSSLVYLQVQDRKAGP